MADPAVAVVIPARNAGATLSETLDSLLAQTTKDWKAIVVDDGSTDGTLDVARAFAESDARIAVISGPHAGVSAARNAGIAASTSPWVLFLDADDWIAPTWLERGLATLSADPALDGVVCDTTLVDAAGRLLGRVTLPADVVGVLGERCAFPIHSCLVRRTAVTRAGAFDVSLVTCEDWDLWLRIARAGARFGRVADDLAVYRTRPGSASRDVARLLPDGLHVIDAAHAADPRASDSPYAGGLPPERRRVSRVRFALWCAGVALAAGRDAVGIVEAVRADLTAPIDATDVARRIVGALCFDLSIQSGEPWAACSERLPLIDRCLAALASATGDSSLAVRVRRCVDREIAYAYADPRPLPLGRTLAIAIEATQPIPDVGTEPEVDRLLCDVAFAGERVGTCELPVCDGLVPARVLADAIAAELGWGIIGRFFGRTVYGELVIDSETGTLRRGGRTLAETAVAGNAPRWLTLHQCVYWPVFLRELWGRSDWLPGQFYDPSPLDEPRPQRTTDGTRLSVEVSENLADWDVPVPEVDVVVHVAGTAIGVVSVAAASGVVRAEAVRSAIVSGAGTELTRAVVREAILGWPLDAEPGGLRARLAVRAAERAAPDSAPWLGADLDADVVLAGRCAAPIGTSASRAAALPAAALASLLEAAAVAGEPVVRVSGAPGKRPRVRYAPDIAWPAPVAIRRPSASATAGETHSRPRGDRAYFESVFAERPDPWPSTTDYERRKYDQTLALLPDRPIGRALEIGCAEGHFTRLLGPRVERLVAADISRVALERTAEVCRELPNVTVAGLDLVADDVPGPFDLIVCSEMLYHVGDIESLRRVARKIAGALAPGGRLIGAHENLVVDDPEHTGFDWDECFGARTIGEVVSSMPELRFVKELRTPLYRIQCWERSTDTDMPARAPIVIEALHSPPVPEVAEHICWGGGAPRRHARVPVTTAALPILMYHRIAPEGTPGGARWRVDPQAFEQQLAFLRDAGHYGVTLETWRQAMTAYTPLPGRAVLLTFDDGFRDFREHAWPLLSRYGFPATLFVVADRVGGVSEWNRPIADVAPLLDWDEIRALARAGVEIGSHSATHRPLTALGPAGVVIEAARSRALLHRALGTPVTSFAYPEGEVDDAIRHLVGAAGYVYGLTCRAERAPLHAPLLGMPRLEVRGDTSLADFVRMVSA